MANTSRRRRFFAIKSAIAKKAANDNKVVINGQTITVTEDNAQLVEICLEADAQAAYEAACGEYDRETRGRIAA